MAIRLTKSQARKLAKKSKGNDWISIINATMKDFAKSQIKSIGQDLFLQVCYRNGLPTNVEFEYEFHPERGWRFDYLFPKKVALEVEGIGGRHQFIKGFLEDMKKYREAAIMGYCVIRVTTRELESGEAFELVKRAIEARNWDGKE